MEDERPTPIVPITVPDGALPDPDDTTHARPRAPALRVVGRGPVRQLRRIQGPERRHAGARDRRAALPHRPQRRRQDDADGRHHGQDAARHRRRVPRPARERPDQAVRVPHRRDGRRAQVPAADGVPGAHGLRELRAGAARPQGRVEHAVQAAHAGGARSHPGDPEDHRARGARGAAGRACWRTARSSGWRSACCWRRTRRCCWSTSRWPG